MKNLLENISTSTIYISFSLAVLGGITAAAFWRYKKYLGLKNAYNLEYKKFNNNFDLILKEYQKFNEQKKIFIYNKNIFEDLIKKNDLEEKWVAISKIPSNEVEALNISYKKLQALNLSIKDIKNDLISIDNGLLRYVKDFESVFKTYKYKVHFEPIVLHDDSNFNLIQNLKNLFKFWDINSMDKQLEKQALFKELEAFKYSKKISNTVINNLQKRQENLIEEYKISAHNFNLDINDFLNSKIQFINENIIVEENEFLNVNKDHLNIIKKLNKLNDQFFINENLLKTKNALWDKNEVHQQFINSNETYFWICYDEFWTGVKNKLSWSKSSNLNLIDTNTISKFELTHLNNYDLHDLYFRLNVFYVQMWLFKHCYLLKYLIPTFYTVIFGLIGYILYKKFKFVYSCYKTKTLKVTFLNWLFDSEIIFTISKLGLFYSITIILLLGVLYYFSGFGYWLAFIFCGRVFFWNWIKFSLFKLNKKYNWYKK